MIFDPGLGIVPVAEPLGFRYLPGVFGPEPELRSLDAIRPSLRDPDCIGPDPVYGIAMDVGRQEFRSELERRMLLFGVVTYAAGTLGDEPVRSQGHVHRVSKHSGWSPPEVYEIWSGVGCVYMQEHAADDPGRCYAILAGPGDLVVVPPGWAHATISADRSQMLTFGALCDREYGFEYTEIRKRKGLAWYPLVGPRGGLRWEHNPLYVQSNTNAGIEVRGPGDYSRLGLRRNVPLYRQTTEAPERLQWVSRPDLVAEVWREFTAP